MSAEWGFFLAAIAITVCPLLVPAGEPSFDDHADQALRMVRS